MTVNQFSRLIDSNMVYISVTGIDLSAYELKPKDTIVLCVGARRNPTLFKQEMSYSERNQLENFSQFRVTDPERTSFMVIILKRRIFGGDVELGEIHLRCAAFELDSVVSHTFDLDTPKFQTVKPKISLDVHIDTTSGQPFYAPPGQLSDDYKISHDKCMFG